MRAEDRMAEGYEPNFDIDYEVGKQGELFVARAMDAIRDGSCEVKTDDKALATGNLYFEVQCMYRGSYEYSGIATSKADLWAHVVGPFMIVAPTEAVRAVVRKFWMSGLNQKNCMRGSHPTRGVAIPIETVVKLLRQGTT